MQPTALLLSILQKNSRRGKKNKQITANPRKEFGSSALRWGADTARPWIETPPTPPTISPIDRRPAFTESLKALRLFSHSTRHSAAPVRALCASASGLTSSDDSSLSSLSSPPLQILELVKGMHYQLACQKYFELTHSVSARPHRAASLFVTSSLCHRLFV